MIHSLRISRFVGGMLLLPAMFLTARVSAQTVPTPTHVVILIEENYAYSDIIGSANAPYINALCSDTDAAVFTQCFAIEHPSEPNYMDFFSGNNQGTTGSDALPAGYPFTTPNFGAQLINAGKTFITYSEDLPAPGSDVQTYTSGGANYARKHNPCTNWVGTGTNQFSGTVVNLPFTGYFPDSAHYSTLPTVCYVVPNMTNDMHDGSYPTNITLGDTWFHSHLDSFLNWARANNTLLIITFDEDDDLHSNNIPTIFYGPMVKGGTYSEHTTLYAILNTVEQMYGLSHIGSAATATTITDCWRTAPITSVNNVANDHSFKVVPNPAANVINFIYNSQLNNTATINVFDATGRLAGRYAITGASLQVNTSSFDNGVYSYNVISDNGKMLDEGKFVIAK